MHHSEQKCANSCCEWCNLRYGTGVFWDLRDCSIALKKNYYFKIRFHCMILSNVQVLPSQASSGHSQRHDMIGQGQSHDYCNPLAACNMATSGRYRGTHMAREKVLEQRDNKEVVPTWLALLENHPIRAVLGFSSHSRCTVQTDRVTRQSFPHQFTNILWIKISSPIEFSIINQNLLLAYSIWENLDTHSWDQWHWLHR